MPFFVGLIVCGFLFFCLWWAKHQNKPIDFSFIAKQADGEIEFTPADKAASELYQLISGGKLVWSYELRKPGPDQAGNKNIQQIGIGKTTDRMLRFSLRDNTFIGGLTYCEAEVKANSLDRWLARRIREHISRIHDAEHGKTQERRECC